MVYFFGIIKGECVKGLINGCFLAFLNHFDNQVFAPVMGFLVYGNTI